MVSELATLQSTERIAAVAAILGGLVVVFLLRPVTPRRTALGAGGALSTLGVIALIDSFSLAPDIFLVGLVGLTWTVQAFFVYRVSGHNLRVMVPFSALALFILRIIVPEISLSLIFGYVAVSLAVVSSVHLSKADVSIMARGKGGLARILMSPFAAIHKAVAFRARVPNKQLALFGSYLAFELAILIGIPMAAVLLSNGLLGFDTLILVVVLLYSIVLVGLFRVDSLKGK